MTFMYLSIRPDKEGKLHVRLQDNGSFKVHSLGGPNSRMTHDAEIIMRVEGFDGLDALADKDLVSELLRRFTTKELLQRLQIRLSNEELLQLVADRVNGRPA